MFFVYMRYNLTYINIYTNINQYNLLSHIEAGKGGRWECYVYVEGRTNLLFFHHTNVRHRSGRGITRYAILRNVGVRSSFRGSGQDARRGRGQPGEDASRWNKSREEEKEEEEE